MHTLSAPRRNQQNRFFVIGAAFATLLFALALTACGGTTAPANNGKGAAPADADKTANSQGDQLEKIKKAGKLVVGVEGTYPPFTYHDKDGNLTGFDVELARAVAQKLGVTAEFVESDWDSLLAGIDSGRLDTVINDVSVTPERSEKYDFSTPYLYIPQQVVVKGSSKIASVDDLKGKKVATNITNAYANQLESYGATIVSIKTSDEAANQVLSGRADFCMFSPIILNDYLDQHPDADLRVAFKLDNAYETIAIPVVKGQDNLHAAVNDAVESLIKDGTVASLSNKYFKGDYTQKP